MERALRAAVWMGLALSGACAPSLRQGGDEVAPDSLLTRAIEEAGGSAALSQVRAFQWYGRATVQLGGQIVNIAGRWSVQPPDSAVVSTYDVEDGPAGTRTLVLAAPRGWLVTQGQFTPMPPTMLSTQRAEFYLYELIRLVSLMSPNVTRTAAPPDSLGQRGVRIEQRDRPSAVLHFDDDGRLSHIRLQVPSGRTRELEWQDAWLEGEIESSGVRWPRELRLLVNGKPYFDLTIESLKVLPRLTDPLLRGPR